MTTAAPRRRAGQRLSAALWALLVIGAGALSIVAYSGAEIDLELAAIILLAAVGGWMLLSAALSGLGRKREIAAATAPTVEETTEASVEAAVATAIADADAAVTDAAEEVRRSVAEVAEPFTRSADHADDATGDGAAPDAPSAPEPVEDSDVAPSDADAETEDVGADGDVDAGKADDEGRSR
ncbi:hypothetical protein [Demequina sp. NBRC 110056]|uniref:hypothetical protein n=1 Tax=Demequina sp. NBRC 110056 TaxID=1570345 RepID=UPI000A01ECCB|nr:hypothetical protein [Demequina sp. NBRC 110056]